MSIPSIKIGVSPHPSHRLPLRPSTIIRSSKAEGPLRRPAAPLCATPSHPLFLHRFLHLLLPQHSLLRCRWQRSCRTTSSRRNWRRQTRVLSLVSWARMRSAMAGIQGRHFQDGIRGVRVLFHNFGFSFRHPRM